MAHGRMLYRARACPKLCDMSRNKCVNHTKLIVTGPGCLFVFLRPKVQPSGLTVFGRSAIKTKHFLCPFPGGPVLSQSLLPTSRHGDRFGLAG